MRTDLMKPLSAIDRVHRPPHSVFQVTRVLALPEPAVGWG